MPLFVPNLILNDVTDINIELLNKYNIKGLILDVDNTLTIHGSQDIKDNIRDWLNLMRINNIALTLVSNNSYKRIKPFANKIGLDFTANGLKPMTVGFTKAQNSFKLDKANIAVVGDQIYTDVLGGNIKGMFTILVTPFELEQKAFFKLKRFFERAHINKYNKINKNGGM